MKVKLGELTKIRTGKLDANASSPDGEYPFFTCSKEPLKISSYSYDCECVLVAGNGDLNVKYYNGKFDAYQRTYIIEDNSNGRLYLPYLYYFMNGYVEELRKLSIGGVIKYIKLRNLTDALIELPDIETQKYIVSILSKIKELIDSRYQELKILENLIKARFVEMFGDPIINSRRLETKPLEEVFVLKAGDFTAASDIAEKPSVTHKYPCYGGNGIRGYVKEYNQDGDFSLIGRQGALSGNVQFASGRFKNTEHALLVTPIVRMNNIWLNQLLLNLELKRYQTGAAQPGLSVKNLQKIPIIMVPIDEQNQFAAFVAAIDKSKLLSGCRLFHSWAPENRDKPKHVGVPQRKTKVLRGGRRQQ